MISVDKKLLSKLRLDYPKIKMCIGAINSFNKPFEVEELIIKVKSLIRKVLSRDLLTLLSYRVGSKTSTKMSAMSGQLILQYVKFTPK